jgi:hypothetical protein
MALCRRFHGSEVILTDVTAARSVLVLQELQEDQAGDYRCRANNDHSTIYSQPATLQVKGEMVAVDITCYHIAL